MTQPSEAGSLASSFDSAMAALIALFNKLKMRTSKKGVTPSNALPASRPQDTPAVVGLELTPAVDFDMTLNERTVVMAVPLDENGSVVQGVTAEWESSDETVVAITRDGEATALRIGEADLTASAGGHSATIRAMVGNSQSLLPGEGTLPDEETDSLYAPANIVGSPPGKTTPSTRTAAAATAAAKEMPGSANFNFGFEIVSIPGRGIETELSLNYNSRLWNKSRESDERTRLTYDVDSGWPSPGFRLGYGQLESQGADNFTLIDPDGTRHPMPRLAPGTSPYYDFQTTDGTFTVYNSATKTLTYPDGTRVQYDVGGTGTLSYPIKIEDRNGNYILISYVTRYQPQIKSIQDTLGRFVRFYYTNGELTSITAPTYENRLINGSREMTVARFYYADLSLSTNFNTAIDVTAPTVSQRVIKYVNFPDTRNGYRFDYSIYGMIYKIIQLRGMTANASGVTNEGQTAAWTAYDYQGSPGGIAVPSGGLTDVPFYKHRTDEWAGRTTSGGSPAYTFDVDEENGLTTITAPDSTTTTTQTIVSPGQWDDGLIASTTVKLGSTILSKISGEWEHDGQSRNPRLKRFEVTDDGGQTRATLYSSYDQFNNVEEVRELDFSAPGTNGAELRRTVLNYEDGDLYLRRRLIRLVKSAEIYSVNGTTATLVSKVSYGYDTVARQNLTAYTDIKMHDRAYNPAFPTVFDSTIRSGDLTTVTSYPDVANLSNTIVTWQHYDIAGNIVSAKLTCCQQITYAYSATNQYAYQESETSGSGDQQLATSATYDKYTGLIRTVTDENAQITTIDYEPETLRHSKTTLPNGAYTESLYDDSLYPEPDQQHMHSVYITQEGPADSDGGNVTSYQYLDGRGAVTRTLVDNTAEGYSTIDIAYDKMGQIEKTSNAYLTPYANRSTQPINPSNQWMKRAYDSLGRLTTVTPPDGNLSTDVNVLHINYYGHQLTVVDPANGTRRQITDALGRVIRLDEQDATGSLGSVSAPSQATYYWYDALNNVIKTTQGGTLQGGVVQGGQSRFFMYDSLSRLLRERQVEEDAPYTNLPDPLTGNSAWSCRYEYNDSDHGLLTDSYNARQIHTHYSYDSFFHRLTGITYTGGVTTNANEVLPPNPAVTYTYGNDAASYNKGQLIKVETAAVGTSLPKTVQEFGFDLMGRVNQQTQTVGNNIYKLAYGYTKLGQLRTETFPSGRVVSYDYRDGAHLSGVRDSSRTYLSDINYSASGSLASETLGNELTQLARTFGYNTRQQLSQITLTKNNTTLQRYDYKYGIIDMSSGEVNTNRNFGQIARVEGFIGGTAATPIKQWQQRISYDYLGRLAKVAEHRGDNGNLSYNANYSYDVFSNKYQLQSQNPVGAQEDPQPFTRVEDNEINKSNNRFISTGATPVVYDAAGNMIEDRKFRLMQYRYDVNGRQRWAKKINDNSEVASVYDGIGQRVAMQTSTDGWQYLVYDIFGQLISEYGGASDGTSGVRFLTGDHQGSIRAVMDGSGTVLARHDFTPWGEELAAGTGQRTTGQGYDAIDKTRQKYAGSERDPATGLDHTWWRKYDSASGRWTTPDPYKGSMRIGNPQSLNRYAYVLNDPINFSDPTGLDDQADIDEGVRAARHALQGALCRSLFQGYKGDPRKLLESYAKPENNLISVGSTYPVKEGNKIKREPFGDPNIGAKTVYGVGQYTENGVTNYLVPTITINSEGFYKTLKYDGRQGKPLNSFRDKGFFGLNQSQLRGAIILHELAHVVKAIPDDLHNREQSKKNSERVRLLCFSPLNQIDEELRTTVTDIVTDLGGDIGIERLDRSDQAFAFDWGLLHPGAINNDSQTDPEGPPNKGPRIPPTLKPPRPRS